MADLDFKLVIDASFEKLGDIQKSLEKLTEAAEKTSKALEKSFGKKLESLGKTLTASLTLPIAAFAKFSIDAFKEQEKNIAKFTDSFQKQGGRIGKTFEQMKADAQDFSKNTLFEDDDILGGVTSQLLNFTEINTSVFNDAQKVIIDFAAKTGTSLEASTEAIAKALQNPTEGLNLLKRQGLAVTDSQIALIAQLDKSGKSLEAQTEIIKLLNGQYGGFAEKLANTDTGKFEQLGKAFKQLKEDFGEAFLKVFRPIIEFLTDLVKWIDKLTPQSKVILAFFASFVAAIGPVIFVIGSLTTALAALEIPLLAIAGPVGWLALLVIGLVAAAEHFGTLGNAVDNFTLLVNTNLDRIFKLVDKIPTAFALVPQVALLKIASKALRDTVEENIKFLEHKIQKFTNAQDGPMGPIFKPDATKPPPKKILFTPEELAELDKLSQEHEKALESQKDWEFEMNQLKGQLAEINAGEQILANSFATFFEDLAFGAKSAADAIKDLGRTIAQSLFSTFLRNSLNSFFAGLIPGFTLGAKTTPPNPAAPIGTRAGGGLIQGPGSATSDSILARLSNNEFVIRAASVKKFGVDFFDHLNRGIMPKLNIGGHIQAIRNNLSGVPRFATGGSVAGSGNVFVNVVNNSSQPVQAKTTRSFDARGSIVNVVLEDLRTNGPISQQMQGAFSVTR